MRTVGLIGGLSWESTAIYYQQLNRIVQQRLGGVHSAQIAMLSLDFGEIARLQHAGEWPQLGRIMVDCANKLATAGAELIVVCSNTMHKLAPVIEAECRTPLLHIADPTGKAIKRAGIRKVGLLGTKFTMHETFLRQRLSAKFGLEVVVPTEAEQGDIHRVIYEELTRGIVRDGSRQRYVEVINGFADAGCCGVILGCTEIMLLIRPEDSPVPTFDSTSLHVESAVDWMLAGNSNAAQFTNTAPV
jgi:aspartate racemase